MIGQTMKTSRRLTLTMGLLLAEVALAKPPRLESLPTGSGVAAWTRGVAYTRQRDALALFEEGNKNLEDNAFRAAAANYRQALKHWDHPAIHYNLALALMDSDQPTEVHQHLTAATRFGATPLDESKYQYALDYKARLEKKMAWLDVSCDEPGAIVSLDGRQLFTAPSQHKELVNPGVHNIMAVKPGGDRVDTSRNLTLAAGGTVGLDLKMYRPEELTQYRNRWAGWMPWTVMGSGLAMVAGGGLLHWQAVRNYSAVDKRHPQLGPTGCTPNEEVQSRLNQGNRMQTAAWGAYGLGGAGVLTGAVLLYLNRPKPYQIDPATGKERVSITPFLGSTSGVQATFHS